MQRSLPPAIEVTKLWKGNVFSRVCPSFCVCVCVWGGGYPCDHYHDVLNLTVQPPSPQHIKPGTPLAPAPPHLSLPYGPAPRQILTIFKCMKLSLSFWHDYLNTTPIFLAIF